MEDSVVQSDLGEKEEKVKNYAFSNSICIFGM